METMLLLQDPILHAAAGRMAPPPGGGDGMLCFALTLQGFTASDDTAASDCLHAAQADPGDRLHALRQPAAAAMPATQVPARPGEELSALLQSGSGGPEPATAGNDNAAAGRLEAPDNHATAAHAASTLAADAGLVLQQTADDGDPARTDDETQPDQEQTEASAAAAAGLLQAPPQQQVESRTPHGLRTTDARTALRIATDAAHSGPASAGAVKDRAAADGPELPAGRFAAGGHATAGSSGARHWQHALGQVAAQADTAAKAGPDAAMAGNSDALLSLLPEQVLAPEIDLEAIRQTLTALRMAESAGNPGLRTTATAAAESGSWSLQSDALAGSEGWSEEIGSRISWLRDQGINKAELSLHPAELGALDITIHHEDDRISVSIVTRNDTARELLQESLPRLAELLRSSGLALEQGAVSQQGPGQREPAGRGHAAAGQEPTNGNTNAAEAPQVRRGLLHQGHIDHYV